jgi:transposase
MKDNMDNGLDPIIAQAIAEMKAEAGNNFQLERINLAELGRRTGISRAKLRRLKENGFKNKPHGLSGRKAPVTLLSGYSSMLDAMLKAGIDNSSVHFARLQAEGYTGSQSTVKRYIDAHRDLIPAKRQLVAPQGSRGQRYTTDPGEAFQMDWGFVKVQDHAGNVLTAACFAMICHHCGERYVEFFPNAKQENLFIGMIHAFQYMGIPTHILTDNMKSVVVRRDMEGKAGVAKRLRNLHAQPGFCDQAVQAPSSIHKRESGTARPFREREFSCRARLLERDRSEPTSTGMVQPPERHLPSRHRRRPPRNAHPPLC